MAQSVLCDYVLTCIGAIKRVYDIVLCVLFNILNCQAVYNQSKCDIFVQCSNEHPFGACKSLKNNIAGFGLNL